MALRINELQNEGAIGWVAEWPFQARVRFIKSNAYDAFLRELRRYVRGEVAGRSFLIAGHRGAGKTTLVREAVEHLNRSIIESAINATKSEQDSNTNRKLDQQRPLLVHLHGPSLLAPEKPVEDRAARTATGPEQSGEPADGGAAPRATPRSNAIDQSSVAGGETARTRDEAKEVSSQEKAATASTDPAVIALEQITIALYRALAAEFGRSFANHARDEIYQARLIGDARAPVADFLELAGQFTLELDNIPRPATLRDFYQRLGRMDAGVLWPFDTGAALQEAGLNDRGVREIVALSTAAQAFEVCSGEIKSTLSDKDTRSREHSVETKGEATLKDAINKIVGIASGLGVGILASSSVATTEAVGLGLLTGILSTLTLSWTSKRSAKSERTLDYTFIRKRDKQSLERDLPLVIQRVREAGLAPVFVLDELDKVENATTSIANLIKRLKHLTTDFGCFCFLTDRTYYDELIRKVEREAFPVEHTFFSHLLFILPHPDKFLTYLRDITQPEVAGAGTGASPATSADNVARSIFGLFVLHRSKLNMAEVLREIAEQCDEDGWVKPLPAELRRLEYVFAASIQLAIGFILKRDAIRQRVEADPRFMQWAIDAIYILSRAWERKAAKVVLNRHAIVQCLLARSGKGNGASDPEAAEQALLDSGMGSIDLDIIDRNVALLTELLCSSSNLKSELSKAGHAELAEIIPPQNLLKCIDPDRREFEFLYDMYGEEVAVRERLKAALAAANLPTDLAGRIASPLDFLQEFEGALRDEGVTIPDLIALQILPATIDAGELKDARDRLEIARAKDRPYDKLLKDLPLIGSLVSFVDQNGSRLAALLRLGLQVAANARLAGERELRLQPALHAIARYVDLRSLFQQSAEPSTALDDIVGRPPDPSGPAPSGDVGTVQSWRSGLAALREDLVDSPPPFTPKSSEAWNRWAEQIKLHLSRMPSVTGPAYYDDIVGAAANLPPGNVFRRDLGQLSLAEWSELCLSGFGAPPSRTTPTWTFSAGLCALGFGRDLVAKTGEFASDAVDQRLHQEMLPLAPEIESPAYVLVIRDDGPSVAHGPMETLSAPPSGIPESAPLLALPETRLKSYDAALQWLKTHRAFVGIIYEEAEP